MIRKATLNDVYRIAEMNVYGWRNTYKGIMSDEELFINRRVDRAIAGFSKGISEGKNQIFIYEDDNNEIIKGMIGYSDCRDDDKPEAYELYFIYIETIFSREGIGSKLLKYFEDEGIRNGKKEMIVWVLEKNTIGRNFYNKNGYKFDGTKKYLNELGVMEIRYSKIIE